MSKKYHITDADGEQYFVEEVETADDEIIEAEAVPALTDEEIATLRSLIERVPEIIALLDEEKADEEEMPPEPEQGVDADEEVIDTDEEEEEDDEPIHDSKKSFGSLAKKKAIVDDSLTDDIAIAWAKRYGGNK